MVTDRKPWLETGDTAEDALREILPDETSEKVAWLDNTIIPLVDQDPASQDDDVKKTVTVIYEERPPEDWTINLTPRSDHWEAFVISRKKLRPRE